MPYLTSTKTKKTVKVERYYLHTKNMGTLTGVVEVQSLSFRKKCACKWMSRHYNDRQSGWDRVCRICGSLGRGPAF